jgi:hypothetical protein
MSKTQQPPQPDPNEEIIERSYRGLTIKRGKRHCQIVDKDDEIIFRTTNLRDAENYLNILEENDRLHRLLDARGIAPHRIYLLAADETKRGRVSLDGIPSKEVVIVAKAPDGALVVRHLEDGREEIVDFDDIEPIEGGAYLQGPDVIDETVHVVLRLDKENDQTSVSAFRSIERLEEALAEWTKEEHPGSEYAASPVHAEPDLIVWRAEVSIED